MITVEQGGSFDIAMEWNDGGYNSHYANVFVDWDQNGDWSTAPEYQLMADEDDGTVVPKATISVPENAPTGGTLLRLRLSWNGFDGPSATGEFGEVNDFTIVVE